MTITVDLPPESEAYLRLRAAQVGEKESALAARMLAQFLAADEADFHETVAAIQEGLDDVAAGRTITLEEYQAEVMAKRKQRDAQKAAAA